MSMTKADRALVAATMVSLNLGEIFLYVPLAARHCGMKKELNLRYADGKRTELDIVFAKDGKDVKKPLFVYIHGGGFVSGDRKSRRYYCYNWAESGFLCANIGYDYALDAAHPKSLAQIFKGIEFAMNRADELNIDTGKVVVAGDSAGGYYAAFVAAVASHPELYDTLGIDFAYRDTFKVSACVLLSGLYDMARSLDTRFPQMTIFLRSHLDLSKKEVYALRGDEKMRAFSAPDYYVDGNFPPCFVVASAYDLLRSESERLRDELEKAGVKNGFYMCKGVNGVHAGSLACDRFKHGRECLRLAKEFVASVLADEPSNAAQPD